MRRGRGPVEDQSGFAAADALVAVTILSSSLAMSLVAAGIGARASRAAEEVHAAELLLRDRLEQTAGRSGTWMGRDRGLAWMVTARPAEGGDPRRAAPCVRQASARADSGRLYRLVTVDICLPRAVG